MATKKSPDSFRELNSELEELLIWFEGGEFDVDQAAEKYDRATEIIKALQNKLTKLKNHVKQHKVTFE